MGDKVNLYPAQATVVDRTVCVFIDKASRGKDENVLKVAIWKHGNDNYVYNKSYATASVTLDAGECVPGIGEFDFIPGEIYSIFVDTTLHSYKTRFSVPRQEDYNILVGTPLHTDETRFNALKYEIDEMLNNTRWQTGEPITIR